MTITKLTPLDVLRQIADLPGFEPNEPYGQAVIAVLSNPPPDHAAMLADLRAVDQWFYDHNVLPENPVRCALGRAIAACTEDRS